MFQKRKFIKKFCRKPGDFSQNWFKTEKQNKKTKNNPVTEQQR